MSPATSRVSSSVCSGARVSILTLSLFDVCDARMRARMKNSHSRANVDGFPRRRTCVYTLTGRDGWVNECGFFFCRSVVHAEGECAYARFCMRGFTSRLTFPRGAWSRDAPSSVCIVGHTCSSGTDIRLFMIVMGVLGGDLTLWA